MARILVHALAATSGGGATYLRQLLREIARDDSPHEWVLLAPPGHSSPWPTSRRLRVVESPAVGSGIKRALFDQVGLRKFIHAENIDLILATANFGMVSPPVPQILLNRNALYFSKTHTSELRRRGEYKELIRTLLRRQLAFASIRASSVNVVPTRAFGEEIKDWLRPGDDTTFETASFGFDHANSAQVTEEMKQKMLGRLSPKPGVRRVLLVSHYNYFRNFDTLLRATQLLKESLPTPIELILTTQLGEGVREHRYDTTSSARLMNSLGLLGNVTMLGNVPHQQLPSLYSCADVVVCPSYAESFGHPMVEAMASAAPLVVSNQPVHREVCQDAALYFSTFEPEQLAFRINQVLTDDDLARALSASGRRRSLDFSWDKHFDRLLGLVEETLKEPQHVAK